MLTKRISSKRTNEKTWQYNQIPHIAWNSALSKYYFISLALKVPQQKKTITTFFIQPDSLGIVSINCCMNFKIVKLTLCCFRSFNEMIVMKVVGKSVDKMELFQTTTVCHLSCTRPQKSLLLEYIWNIGYTTVLQMHNVTMCTMCIASSFVLDVRVCYTVDANL